MSENKTIDEIEENIPLCLIDEKVKLCKADGAINVNTILNAKTNTYTLTATYLKPQE